MKGMKQILAGALAFALLFSTSTIASTATVLAAKKPAISQATATILEGKKVNLNVDNKKKGSTYEWKSSNSKIATVNDRGFVTGIKKGKVTITCVVKVDENTSYTLTSKVTIRKPAEKIQINNKITAANVGQKYNLNRTLTPESSNDLTTLTTSDKTIADPKANGVFTALKEGTVTITATTLSGAEDSVTIKVVDKDGTVTNQKELDALLGSGASMITIKTEEAIIFNIPEGDYSNQILVVSAPNAAVNNKGTFKEVRGLSSGVYSGGGSTGGGSTTPTQSVVTVTPVVENGVSIYTLPVALGSAKEVEVDYNGFKYTAQKDILNRLTAYLANESQTVGYWKNTTNTSNTYGGIEVTVTGTKGSLEKTVEFKSLNSAFNLNATYTVTVNDTNGEVTVVTPANITYVIKQVGRTLSISNAPSNLSFKVTY